MLLLISGEYFAFEISLLHFEFSTTELVRFERDMDGTEEYSLHHLRYSDAKTVTLPEAAYWYSFAQWYADFVDLHAAITSCLDMRPLKKGRRDELSNWPLETWKLVNLSQSVDVHTTIYYRYNANASIQRFHLRFFAILPLYIILTFSIAVSGIDAQACPQWVSYVLETMLANYTSWPGIQLTLGSPRGGLDCEVSIPSHATEFASKPALLDDVPWLLASITKTFTAVAILKLAERGQLDLYASIVNYLPGWSIDLLMSLRRVELMDVEYLTKHSAVNESGAMKAFGIVGCTGFPPSTWSSLVTAIELLKIYSPLIYWYRMSSTMIALPTHNFHFGEVKSICAFGI